MTITALQLADRIMTLANAENAGVSQLKLIKLCYFAQAWNLALNDRPLYEDEIKAWMHGPVIVSVYERFNVFGSSNISYTPNEKDLGQVCSNEETVIKKVWDAYKVFDAWTLRNMTHAEDSPWKQVYNGSSKTVIKQGTIKDFYKSKNSN